MNVAKCSRIQCKAPIETYRNVLYMYINKCPINDIISYLQHIPSVIERSSTAMSDLEPPAIITSKITWLMGMDSCWKIDAKWLINYVKRFNWLDYFSPVACVWCLLFHCMCSTDPPDLHPDRADGVHHHQQTHSDFPSDYRTCDRQSWDTQDHRHSREV